MLEIGALCAVCLALGAVSGYAFAETRERRRDIAPLPEYDTENPINGNAPRETIQIGEITLYRVQ